MLNPGATTVIRSEPTTRCSKVNNTIWLASLHYQYREWVDWSWSCSSLKHTSCLPDSWQFQTLVSLTVMSCQSSNPFNIVKGLVWSITVISAFLGILSYILAIITTYIISSTLWLCLQYSTTFLGKDIYLCKTFLVEVPLRQITMHPKFHSTWVRIHDLQICSTFHVCKTPML